MLKDRLLRFVAYIGVISWTIAGIVLIWGNVAVRAATSDPEPQECYIWAVDTETKRKFLACPDIDHYNICYENMAEVTQNVVRFFSCLPMN